MFLLNYNLHTALAINVYIVDEYIYINPTIYNHISYSCHLPFFNILSPSMYYFVY